MNNQQSTPKQVEYPKTQLSMQDKLATKNFLTIMVVAASAVALIGGYIIYRLSGTYIRQANSVKAQDKLIASLKQKQTDLDALKPAYNTITQKGSSGISDADLILRAVPSTDDYKGLIATLERIGQESGVKVVTVTQSTGATTTSTAATPTAAGAQELGFTVNLEGSYDKILTFLQNTERSARVMNFSSMTLSGNSGTVTASLSMKTYWQPPANIQSTMEPLK